jgi:hypothetical protein
MAKRRSREKDVRTPIGQPALRDEPRQRRHLTLTGALMRTFATFGLGSLGSISLQHSIQAFPADRPHGIASDCWVRLDERLGLVIECAQSAGPSGYFMVKQAGTWQRLALKGE